MKTSKNHHAWGERLSPRKIADGNSTSGADVGHLARWVRRHAGPGGSAPFRCLAAGVFLMGATVLSASAQYVNWYDSTGSHPVATAPGGDWADKEFFLALEAHGLAWNSLYGGGGTLALEYVNSIVHFGIGARSGFGGFAGTDGDEWDVRDMTWDNDVYIPVRLTDTLTVYGGIGVTLHDCEYEGLVQSESYRRSGRSMRYTYSLKTVRYSHGAGADTSYCFGGVRFRPSENFFVFGEYRKTSGTLEMETSDLPASSKYKTLEADFEGNCFIAGVGVLF